VNGVSFSLLVFYFSVDHIQENQLSCDLSLLLGLQCGYIGSSELVVLGFSDITSLSDGFLY
jgi:hypothetical protein